MSEVKSPSVILQTEDLGVYYGKHLAVSGVFLPIYEKKITSFIGPSGCGKSTVLRCFNRLNDLIPKSRITGKVLMYGEDIYAKNIDPVSLRRYVGMVFQRPNPFPKSIYDNIAFGARINGYKGNMDELVASSLKKAALWDEVKNKLRTSALALSGGQQQRLCIARAIAIDPQVVLFDEPCSALDPISTERIESLIRDLSQSYTIILVTHNMAQATRTSDYTAFFNVNEVGDERRGSLVEFNETEQLFGNPQSELTKAYLSGQFG